MSGFGIATLKIPGVCDITLEMSFHDRDGKPLLQRRIDETNAMLRFKHKISNPQWEIREVGDSKPEKKAKKKESPAPTPKPEKKPAEQKPRRPVRRAAKPTEPAGPVKLEREREGSIQGTIDVAAARRLARS